MLNILHYFHVIYVEAHLPNEPNKIWRTDSIVIPYCEPRRQETGRDSTDGEHTTFCWWVIG